MPTPTKFTAENRQKILQALQVGASRRTASHLAGISEKALRDWCARGRDGSAQGNYRKFYEDVLAAEAAPRMRALGIVYQSLPDKPDLAWKFLERKEDGYAPPVAALPPPVTPVRINLSFHEGEVPPSAIESYIEGEIVEQDETAGKSTVRSLPASSRPA